MLLDGLAGLGRAEIPGAVVREQHVLAAGPHGFAHVRVALPLLEERHIETQSDVRAIDFAHHRQGVFVASPDERRMVLERQGDAA